MGLDGFQPQFAFPVELWLALSPRRWRIVVPREVRAVALTIFALCFAVMTIVAVREAGRRQQRPAVFRGHWLITVLLLRSVLCRALVLCAGPSRTVHRQNERLLVFDKKPAYAASTCTLTGSAYGSSSSMGGRASQDPRPVNQDFPIFRL